MTHLRTGISYLFVGAIFGLLAVLATNGAWTRDIGPILLHGLVFAGLIVGMVSKILKRNQPVAWLEPWLVPGGAFVGVYGFAFGALLLHDPERSLNPWLGILFALLVAWGTFAWFEKRDKSCENKPLKAFPDRRFRIVMTLWIIAGTVAWGMYLYKMGGVPLFSKAIEGSRVAMADKGGGGLRLAVYSLVIWGWFVWYDGLTGQRIGCFLRIFGMLWVACMLMALANRAPVVHFFAVPALMSLVWSKKNESKGSLVRRLPVVIALAVTAWIAFGMLGAYRLLSDDTLRHYPEIESYTEDGNEFLLGLKLPADYLLTTAKNYQQVYDIVPEMYDYRYGASYIDPLRTILPGKQFALAMQLKSALECSSKAVDSFPEFLEKPG